MSTVRTTPSLSFSDLIALANTPGPMQGMARAMLLQISDESTAQDRRAEAPGRRAAPAASPYGRGLNLDEPTPGHSSYPADLAAALVEKYGMAYGAPRGDGSAGQDISPAPQAQTEWRDEMDRFSPDLWDKTKMVASDLYDDPSPLIDALHDLVKYVTPVAGNMAGSQDLYRDTGAFKDDYMRNSLEATIQHAPRLLMDVGQTIAPIGFTGTGYAKSLSSLLNRYAAPEFGSSLAQAMARGMQ